MYLLPDSNISGFDTGPTLLESRFRETDLP
jgi:hypothetical protein